MKKTIIIFCFTFFAFAMQVQAQAKIFKGSISDAKVQMTLTRNGKDLSGDYFYENFGGASKLKLAGEIQPDGSFILRETDAGGRQTGTFKGTWKDDETTSGVELEGTWSKPKGAEQNFFAYEQGIYFTSGLSITSGKITENNRQKLYSVDIEYPQIVGTTSPSITKFNALAKQSVNASLSDFKKNISEQTANDLKIIRQRGAAYSITTDYGIEYATNSLVSVQFHDSVDFAGAHPNPSSYTINYDLKNGRELTLANLFQPNSDYLKVISAYCIARLKKQTGDLSDDEWIKKGAAADAGNYMNWSVNDKGLIITFDPYQVAAYAAGSQTVVIPFAELKNVLRENSPISFLKNNRNAVTVEREKFDPTRNASADLADAVSKAQKSGKRIILDVGGEWCIWCVNTDKFFIANPDLAKLRDENFVWLKINFSEENKNEEFLSAYPKVTGYPHLFVLDENGKLLYSQDTSELEAGKSYNLEVYTNFLKKWSPLKSADAPNK